MGKPAPNEPYDKWAARMDAWLAALPADDPIRALDEIEQCVAFSKADDEATERQLSAGLDTLTKSPK